MECKVMPNNIKAEIEVLGTIFEDNKNIVKAIDILKAEDFYNTANKNIFLSMTRLFSKGDPIDVISILESVGEKNVENIGGITYLTEVSEAGLKSTNIEYYCNIIKEKSLRRTVIRKTGLVNSKAYDEKNNIQDLISEVQEIEVSNKKNVVSDFDLFTKTINKIEMQSQSGEKISGMKTGLSSLDKATNGLQKGELSIIAGRPSMGKTAFVLNLMDNLASNGNKGALFELEMTEEALGIRRLAYEAMINSYKLQQGALTDEEWKSVMRIVNNKSSQNAIFTDVSTGIGLLDIKARCKSLKNTVGLDFIVVDHLGLLKLPRADRNDLAIGIITMGLKALAKELDVAVILLCQLSRKCEERADKRPMLSDLRDSGNIEQDADLIMFLYRDEYYNKESEDKNIMECIIAKQRNGATGTLKFAYLANYQKVAGLEMRGAQYV